MKDEEIIELYFKRNERAIEETDIKYGRYCQTIAGNILWDEQDIEECIDDTYMKMWHRIPPTRPIILRAFVGKIVREIALNMYKASKAKKRGEGVVSELLDELEECISDNRIPVPGEGIEVREVINAFLESEKPEARKIFVRRYFFGCDVKEIAEFYDIGESKVKMTLARSRERLRKCLEEEGVTV